MVWPRHPRPKLWERRLSARGGGMGDTRRLSTIKRSHLKDGDIC